MKQCGCRLGFICSVHLNQKLCTNCGEQPRQRKDEMCKRCREVYNYDKIRQEMR